VPSQDVDDLVQEVLGVVVRELPRFDHAGRPGSFRAWLRAVTVNRLRTSWRSQRAQPAAPFGPPRKCSCASRTSRAKWLSRPSRQGPPSMSSRTGK
jgi:DNA-directed RNA polymerase specialized sigma24 family protein